MCCPTASSPACHRLWPSPLLWLASSAKRACTVTRIWAWLVAALGIITAALLYMTGQRDKAKAQAKQAKVALRASEASRDVDTAARKAQEQARDSAQEAQREADERPDDRRPTGTLRR